MPRFTSQLPSNSAPSRRSATASRVPILRGPCPHFAGRTWTALREGLPQENAFVCILRQAMATDPLTPTGLYFGTTSGTLYASPDEGQSWTPIAQNRPAIRAVETILVEE